MHLLAYKSPPESVIAPLTQLLGWLSWLVMLMCIAALIIAGGSFAWNRRMGRHDMEGPMAKVGYVLIAATVLGSASAIAGVLLTG